MNGKEIDGWGTSLSIQKAANTSLSTTVAEYSLNLKYGIILIDWLIRNIQITYNKCMDDEMESFLKDEFLTDYYHINLTSPR